MDYDVSSKVEQRGILTGLLLGNAGRDGRNFVIRQSSQQEDYLLFKRQLLERITGKSVGWQQHITAKGDRLVALEPTLIPLIRVLVKKLHPGGHRCVTRSFLEGLTNQGLALWFMDRGSKSFKRKQGKVHAVELSLNTHTTQAESEVIVAYFQEVWGFRWGLGSSQSRYPLRYRLRMGTQEGKRFTAFVRPWIHESLLYKIHLSQNTTATT